eukprot:TRINITY_DN6264_c0_g2_i1.p1 TRINITY_DN6264_c0_g2~~TRINITY_DN6264_c0_g2_i1.p1  ORF type:complete len:384 (-),score=87.15 TRINITY_DN6264_c0_g2_i1:101-1252(-)
MPWDQNMAIMAVEVKGEPRRTLIHAGSIPQSKNDGRKESAWAQLQIVTQEKIIFENRVEELKAKLLKLERDTHMTELYTEAQDRFDQDLILMEQNSILDEIKVETAAIEKKMSTLSNTIQNIVQEINTFKEQMDEVEGKQKNLEEGTAKLQLQLRQDIRNKAMMDAITREIRGNEELISMTQQMRTVLTLKRGEKAEQLTKLEAEKLDLEAQLKKLTNRQTAINKANAIRKKDLAVQNTETDQLKVNKLIDKFLEYFRRLKSAEIKDLSRTISEFRGMKDLIETSRRMINDVKREHEATKARPNDVMFELATKLGELIDNNIVLRLKVLDYIEGITAQTSAKLEEFYAENPAYAPGRRDPPVNGAIRDRIDQTKSFVGRTPNN